MSKKFKKQHKEPEQESLKEDFKLSKYLTPEERKQYNIIGEPDFKQNWLELFTPNVINDLITIKNSCSDNNKKASYIRQEMSYYGFEILGQGTNILPLVNSAYPGVVFKVALDDCGVADNFNDCILQNMVPYYCEMAEIKNPENRYTKVYARHPSSIVSVQRRDIVIKDPRRLDSFRGKILKLLKILSNDFLIADLSPDRFLNYGVGRDGEFTILDGSDLYPLALVKNKLCCNNPVGMDKHHSLKRCEGKLHYNGDFSKLVCEKCGKEFNPVEFRPNKEENNVNNALMDGYTKEERIQMEEEEKKAISDRSRKTIKKEINIAYGENIKNDSSCTDSKPKYKVPDSCYKEFGSDLDGCSRQENEGCSGCSCLEKDDHIIYIDKSSTDEEEEPDVEKFNVDESHTRDIHSEYAQMQNPKNIDDDGDEDEEETNHDSDDEPAHLVYANHQEGEDEEEDTEDSGKESMETAEELNPRIDIKVVENEGLYLTIHGDFDEAWEESGIPIFVCIDDEQTYTRAVSTPAMKTLLMSIIKRM